MRRCRPRASVTVTAEQRKELESWSRRPKTAQALAMRSRIVLLAAFGSSNISIAQQLSTTAQTAGKWRRRFLCAGCDGLLGEPRPGTPRKLTDRQVEQVLASTRES
jgi:transposase